MRRTRQQRRKSCGKFDGRADQGFDDLLELRRMRRRDDSEIAPIPARTRAFEHAQRGRRVWADQCAVALATVFDHVADFGSVSAGFSALRAA